MSKVRTARGAVIDMGALAALNSTAVALGNAGMNARGDLVDRSGRVLKAREVVVQEYYASNPKAVESVSLRDLGDEVLTPAEAIAKWEEAARAQHAAEVPQVKVEPKRKRKIVEED